MLDFLVDENMPLSAAATLQELGYQACHVREIGLPGARDEIIFAQAQEEGWIIFTLDLGFGNLLRLPAGDTRRDCCPTSTSYFHRQAGQRLPQHLYF